jgi:CelD/BcsL family acetyltransferase involved in cellulose biosynthesis
MVMSTVKTTAATDADLLLAPAWDALTARAGTVFQTSRFLLSWWADAVVKNPAAELIVVGVSDGSDHIGQCALELNRGELRFAGGRDVVDYMGPVAARGREADVATALAELIDTKLPWRTAVFEGLVDSNPMTRPLIDELTRRDPPIGSTESYDRAPRLRPGPTPYLARLNSKRRKEVLRKRTRLHEAVGEITVRECAGAPALDRLLAWKEAASPDTRAFVASYGGFVRQLVATLAAAGEAHVAELHSNDRPLASAIVFTHRDTRYLYNMSYDLAWLATAPPGLAPGVVLASQLAEQTLDSGREFDFLKGGQDYKLQLGGVPEDLIRLTLRRTPN